MRKLHGYFLAGLLALSAIGSAASFSLFSKKPVQVNAESICIGTDARENYKKWGADSNPMDTQTMFYVNCSKDGTSGSKVSKDITYTWSGCSNPLEKSSSYIEIDGGGTFTMTLTNIPNYQYLLYTRNSFYDAKGNPDMNFTITVTCGSKTSSATGTVGNGNYLNAFLDLYGGNSSTVTFNIKNNASGKVYLASAYFDVYFAYNDTFNFDKQSGSGGSDSASVWYYFPYSKITIPSRSGYNFLGYYDSASGGTQYFKADGNPTNATWLLAPSSSAFSDKKLYAQWEVAEQVVNVAAGTGVKSVYLSTTSTATSGKASGSKFNSGETVYAFAELAKGYKAKSGWTKVSGTAETEGAKYRVASQTVGTTTVNFGTIAADLITYTITYNGISGATVSGNPSSYNVNTDTFTLKNPTKVGYTFTGWSGTGISDKSSSVSVAKGSIGNRAYTANWDANKYNVTFDTTYGTGGIDATKLTYDSTLPDLDASQIPTRESSSGHSYSFGGYYTEMPTLNEDGSLTSHGKQYYNEFGKGIGLWKEASNTTLYAYWTIDMTVSSSSWSGTWSHEDGKPNTGVKHGITVTPEDPEDAVVWYGLEAGKCNSTNAEAFLRSDAGVYEIFFEVRKDGFTTYYGSETITINKDESIIDPRPTAVSGLEYTALDQELVVAGQVDYGNMLYAVNTTGELPADSEFTASIPTGKLVDTYYVFYKSSGDGNHNPYAVVETEVITIEIARVDRTDISNLNNTVLAYLDTINERYPGIAATLEAVRAEVYQDAIVEDNINVEGVNQNIIKLQEALSAAKVDVTEVLIGAIGTVSYPDSKDAIEEAKDYFDDVLNEAEQAAVNATLVETLNKDNKDYSDAKTVADLINAIPEPSDTEEYYKAVEDAKAAYDTLASSNPDAYALVNDATDKEYETILENNVEAKEVIELIDAIGELTYNGGTNDSLADIKSAEAAYEALASSNLDAVVLVNRANHDDLVEARESYDDVDETVELIAAIGEIAHGGENDSKESLDVAREAYDALSEKEKALVNNFEASYKVLDDGEHVYEALVLIDEIGEVGYDSESEEKIQAARAYYDVLSEDQKAQLGQSPLHTLESAETSFSSLKKNADILVIILLIIICLIILGGIWFLIFLLKRRKDDEDEESNNKKGKPVKVMSVGGFLPLIALVSYYLSAPYLALYILSGVALLVWLTDLVLALMKKKEVGPFKKKASSLEGNEEVETIYDENGNIFQIRYIKSFIAKLIQSPEETKKYYEALKNEVLSYKGTHSRVSWHYDAVNSGRAYVLKFAIRGKTLCVYLPLDPEQVERKYKVERSESKRFEDVPCLYRIKNDRRCEYTKELIALVASNLGLVKGEEQHEVYSDLPYEPNKPLVARGLIKEQKIKVNKPAEQQAPETEASSDGDEMVVTEGEKGNVFKIRYIKSFTAKLIQSSDETKRFYEILKNEALSYQGISSRVSWHYDSINLGRAQAIKFGIRGKTLCVYLPLDPEKVEKKYKVEAIDSKKYSHVPCMYRIQNDRRCAYAKALIARVMRKLKAEKGEEQHEVYSNLPYEENAPLINRGLIKELKVPMNQTDGGEILEAKINRDGDEIILTKDAEGRLFEIRFVKSFTAKLSQSDDLAKGYYNELKNDILSYKGTHTRVSWHYDSITLGREKIARFAIRGKTLCVYLALDPNALDPKYKVEPAKGKRYEETPCLYRIKNARRLNYAKELLAQIMKHLEAKKGQEHNEDYTLPKQETKDLLDQGLIKEVKIRR